MKNPNTGKTFLDLSDINRILPDKFKLFEKSVSRGVYKSSCGDLISISNSRAYDKGYIAWYYVYADRYNQLGVKYMLFTIGMKGLVLVPMDKIQEYKVGCSWKPGRYRGEKRYRIDIKESANGFSFINASQFHQKELDLNPYYIPFT